MCPFLVWVTLQHACLLLHLPLPFDGRKPNRCWCYKISRGPELVYWAASLLWESPVVWCWGCEDAVGFSLCVRCQLNNCYAAPTSWACAYERVIWNRQPCPTPGLLAVTWSRTWLIPVITSVRGQDSRVGQWDCPPVWHSTDNHVTIQRSDLMKLIIDFTELTCNHIQLRCAHIELRPSSCNYYWHIALPHFDTDDTL